MEGYQKDLIVNQSKCAPEESVLLEIARNAWAPLGVERQPSCLLKIDSVSSRPHPVLSHAQILMIRASSDQQSREFSVLMEVFPPKSTELQAYSTFFRDIAGGPGNSEAIRDELYQIIPRPYLIQKTALFMEHFESVPNFDPLNMDFNHCLVAVESLARFHANSYVVRKQITSKGQGKFELFKKYPFLNSGSGPYSPQYAPQLAPVFEQFFDLSVKVIQQDNPSLAFKMQRKFPNPERVFDKMLAILEQEKYDNDDFYVICHGAFLPNSMTFTYDPHSKDPVSCRLGSFHSLHFAPLATDLAMFLLIATSLQFRQNYEEKLLAFYCDAFQDQVVARMGANTPGALEFEQNIDEFHRMVERQYMKMAEFAFYNACVLLPIILFENSPKSLRSSLLNYPSIKSLAEDDIRNKYFPPSAVNLENFTLHSPELAERLVDLTKQIGIHLRVK